MKPLVLYCRWQGAKLRLMGRSETAVWGELAFEETKTPFRFQLQDWLLTLGEEDETQTLKLDEMGVVVNEHSDG
jgi:hypothetical protein